MTFERPDPERFKGFKYAYEAARRGGSMPTVFNAANERAVALFLEDRIGFTDIADLIKHAMDTVAVVDSPDVSQILEAEAKAVAAVDEGLGRLGEQS